MSKDIFVRIEQRDGNIENASYELLGGANSLKDFEYNVLSRAIGK